MQGKLILVVDNELDLRTSLANALADRGFRVATAANGLQALHAIAKERPAVVLLDLRMPMLDGHGFAERLAEAGMRVGIIAMSAYPVSREELRQLGAVAFLAKPFELDDLVRRIDERSMGESAAPAQGEDPDSSAIRGEGGSLLPEAE
jgi:two-component system, OmpR family, response regulator MprA